MAMNFCDISKLNFEEMIQSGLNKGSVAICEGMLKDKDTRIKQMEEIYKTNTEEKNKEIAIKETELLSERKRLALLKEFISNHTKCVGCKNQFDTLLHIPYVLTCGHTICSYCFFNIPIISDEQEKRYAKYIEEILPPPPSSLQRNDSGDFSLKKITKAVANVAESVLGDNPVERIRFMRRYQEIQNQIEQQQKHLQGFDHIGKCPLCKTPQRGLRYDLLATFTAVKNFSFGRKSIKRNKKSKSIKRKSKNTIKNKKSKRKSSKKSKKNKRKSIKRNKKK
jgi:hypothetical protein